jgi:ERCC4-type nuclease
MSIEAVILDSREPEWVKALTFGGAPTVTMQLEFGDVHVSTDDGALLVIERKTPTDFLNTLRDERLFPQVRGMLKLSRWSYVIITGEIKRGDDGHAYTDERTTGWDWKAVQGAILTVQEMGVFVTCCAGDSDFEAAVTRLANRPRDTLYIGPPAREARLMGMGMAVLTSLQGIGPDRAEKLLEHCGSAGQALAALTWKEPQLPGIPRNIRQLARMALGLEPNEILAVNNTDQGVTQ